MDPETAVDIAKDILRNDRITLARVHVSGGGYLASAHENIVGVHSSGSAHYSGRALDINWVNKRHVGWGSDYRMVVDRCRAHGAKQILTPGNDPYGGHHNHVHCGWE